MFVLIHNCRPLSQLSKVIFLYAFPLSHLLLLRVFAKSTVPLIAGCKVIFWELPVK